MSGGDNFTADKLAWLDDIAKDRNVTSGAFRAAYAIAHFLNRKSGEAWPSQATLAEQAGMTRQNLQKAIGTLVDAKYLTIEIGRGRGACNVYRPVKNANHSCRNANHSLQGVQTAVGTTLLIEPFEEPIEGDSISTPSESRKRAAEEDIRFEAFWSLYPRRVAKGAARRAWATALKKTGDAEPVQSARLYDLLQAGRLAVDQPAGGLRLDGERRPPIHEGRTAAAALQGCAAAGARGQRN